MEVLVLNILHPSTSLEWEEWFSLPVGMLDSQLMWLDGTLHVGGGLTLESVISAARLYSLRPGVDSTWTVTDTPTYRYALAVHNSELLLVGGRKHFTHEITNKVLTMKDGEFRESHPPMKEARVASSVVSNGSALVVAGGWDGSNFLSSVEVLKDGQWMTAPSLPSAGGWMKSALHGDLWYIIHWDKSVCRVSLQLLTSGTDSLQWETLPGAPNQFSAAAFFGDCLLSIGGGESYTTTAIYALSSSSQSWEHVADLPVPVSQSSAVVLPAGELLVIGGLDRREYPTATISRAYLEAPIVGIDVPLSLSKLRTLHNCGVNLMEALCKDCYRFHVTSGVQLLIKDRKKVPTLPLKEYIDGIFEAWERSKRPTYPFTWEGLFTVLRKMDLGHLVEEIAKCVTGSVPEGENSPEPSEVKSHKDEGGESSMTELKAEVKHLLLQKESLEGELDELTEEYDKLLDRIEELEKDNKHLRNEISYLKTESKQLPLVKQDAKDLYPVKPEITIESGNIKLNSTSVHTEILTEMIQKLFLQQKESASEKLDQLTNIFGKQLITVESGTLLDKIKELEDKKHYKSEISCLRPERAKQDIEDLKTVIKTESDYQDVPSPPAPPVFMSEGQESPFTSSYQDVPSPHLPPEVMSEPQEPTHSLTLRGVEVVASTSVVLTNSLTTFNWSGFGLRLIVPPDSLPAGVDQCLLDIVASTAGQYQFPDTLHLVSGVFWVRPGVPGPFRRPLTVEVQHCAKMSSSTKLSFVRAHCSQESLPYRFKEIEERGSFTEHSSYGSLEVTHFSGLAIVVKQFVDFLFGTKFSVRLRYVASLYYLKLDPRIIKIYFTINQDSKIHNRQKRKYFAGLRAEEKLSLEIEFKDSASDISLDIDFNKGAVVDEWHLLPLFPLNISKDSVDSFKPGMTIPCAILKATLLRSYWDCKVPRRSQVVTLVGAKEPHNQIRISLDSLLPKEEPPTLTELGIDDFDIIYTDLFDASNHWYNLGLAFGIGVKKLDDIESNSRDNETRLRKMLTQWLQSPRIWTDICIALRSKIVDMVNLAKTVEEKYCKSVLTSSGSNIKRESTTPDPEQGPPKKHRSACRTNIQQ